MKITTKPCMLPIKTYMEECFLYIIKSQWWISFIAICGVSTAVYFCIMWLWITLFVVYILYILFLLLQLYAVKMIPQNKMMFGKLFFDFYEDRIIMHIDTRMAAQFFWPAVQKIVQRKNYYLFFLSKVQVLYVPKNVFCSPFEQQMFDKLLANVKIK